MARRLKTPKKQEAKKIDSARAEEAVVVERKTINLRPEQPKQASQPLQIPGTTPGQLAVHALFRQAEAAAKDIVRFFEFVMRHEKTGGPLHAAFHQELLLRFVSDHDLSVLRMPVGTTKTYSIASIGLYNLGQDQTQRGAIVSKAQGQSAKVLRMISDYIVDPRLSAHLGLVFPWLKKDPRYPWTQSSITVARHAGMRDPSLVAVGLDGQIQGSRISWLVGDDILDWDNTNTADGLEQTASRFDARFQSRLDPAVHKMVVANTPWHLSDLTYRLEANGIPTLSMDVYGNVWFNSVVNKTWIESSGLLRPSNLKANCWRLVGHDPDPDEKIPLWPEVYDLSVIDRLRATRIPHEFARQYLCQPFDESTLRCQRSWIIAARERGRGMLGEKLRELLKQGYPVYTGVDFGFGSSKRSDLTSLFTFLLLPDGDRVVVDIESGRWDGPTVLCKILSKHDLYGSVVCVESNSGQRWMKQFAEADRSNLRVRTHQTGNNKNNIDFGVESIFTELQAGRWIIPCDENLEVPKEVGQWENNCIYYRPPPAHTEDRLMACWIARECSRRGGGGRDPRPRAGSRLSTWGVGGF